MDWGASPSGDDGDIFTWLMNESNGPFYDDPQQQQQPPPHQHGSMPVKEEYNYMNDPSVMNVMNAAGNPEYDVNHQSFGWADSIVADSPMVSNDSHNMGYGQIAPLTDDIGGAMDIVMGGAGAAGSRPAMQAFATEAASGQRRRGTSVYYQNRQAASFDGSTDPYLPNSYLPPTQQPYYHPDPMDFPPPTAPPGAGEEEKKKPRGRRGVKKKDPDAHISPKARAQREKNREAVRNCRKRKREYAQKLKEREKQLEQENAKLRLQLKLGSEETQKAMIERCQALAMVLKAKLDGTPLPPLNGNNEDQVASEGSDLSTLNTKYLQLHSEQDQNRKEATKHIISRLIRQVEPTQATKMYLWQSGQQESYFKNSGGLWMELVKQVGLTEDQITNLRGRRDNIINMCRGIADVLDKLENLHSLVMKKQRLKAESLLFKDFAADLSVEQLSKFVAFVHRHQETEEDKVKWNKYLESFDTELERERLNKSAGNDWVVHNPGSAEMLKQFKQQPQEQKKDDQDDNLLLDRHKSAIVLKELFEREEAELVKFANAAFAKNIDLYDPNTVKVITGIPKVLRYIGRIRRSFEGLKAKEENFMTRKNVGRGRWTLTGTYYGFKSTSAHGSSSSSSSSTGQQREGKKVSFKVIIAYKFTPGSAQIQQLMVSWAALDVMRQLGLLDKAPGYRTFGERMDKLEDKDDTVKSPFSDGSKFSPKAVDDDISETNTVPLPPLTTKSKEQKCIEMTRIFQVDSPDERLEIASELLDDECIFQDANMGGAFSGPDACVDYIRRLRRPFSTMEMTRHTFVNLNKRKRAKSKSKSATEKAAAQKAAAEKLASVKAAIDKDAADLEKGLQEEGQLTKCQMGCLVRGIYTGALVDKPKPYEFNATIFVTFNNTNHKISEVEMSWNAASIMRQLGVLQ